MNHCRLCLGLVPDPKDATKLDSKLLDGNSVADKFNELFGIWVSDCWNIDSLNVLCDDCADKITRAASGQLLAAELDQFKRFFKELEQEMHLFVFSDSEEEPDNKLDPVVPKGVIQKENVGHDWPEIAGKGRMVNSKPVDGKKVLREIQLGQDTDGRQIVVKTKIEPEIGAKDFTLQRI
ncbi:uncharacterized protein LOC120419538 [Culex pipiens pallens]|uniref:uncharacterized protein LOC120419538 n=1 Tax=Culex pipiens pallens TaxID=42434 RepID=UPI001954EC7D|nr:uncharacterized protein LOC120419538 [Culex pipiens pallens]